MLELKNIVKNYELGENTVHALKGVSVAFRKSEFVAILGQSGCGKSTLLNIIGGLDQYTSGDLIINGKSTKDFKDHDWDEYRNNTIGFIFQSYNLIPHQTVLANVELALTLSGISKSEGRRRAIEALNVVGLGDQLDKKPNQMSGGQMQRVAIARALVNNPDVLLADEPTGALDSETSIQVMDLLKQVAKDRLVIMVTHNQNLAKDYATRTIRLVDGNIVDDDNPYIIEEESQPEQLKKTKRMSFFTAFKLSLNNLLTKKGRTILTALAGSIGIIGIALILSVSRGVTNYINTVEESTMSSYPITINSASMDMYSMMQDFMNTIYSPKPGEGEISSNEVLLPMMDSVAKLLKANNLKKFKAYIDNPQSELVDYTTDIVYSYDASINPYIKTVNENGDVEYKKTYQNYAELFKDLGAMVPMGADAMTTVWNQFIGDDDYIMSQYDLLAGHLPTNPNEIVLEVDSNNQISDFILYALGIRDIEEIKEYEEKLIEYNKDPLNHEKPEPPKQSNYSYEDLLGYEYKLIVESDLFFINHEGLIEEYKEDKISDIVSQKGLDFKIVGIVKPGDKSMGLTTFGGVRFSSDMMKYLIETSNDSDVVKLQLDNPNTNMQTGLPFLKEYTIEQYEMIREALIKMDMLKYLPIFGYQDTPEDIIRFANENFPLQSYEEALATLGYVDFASPSAINIYPKNFEAKEFITNYIDNYNKSVPEEDKISYSDMVGLMLSSVTIIIDAISYVLIAFVSISLIVSSIMIGIITYISVLERTKEIGILRAIGASKKDVSRVFNAETFIIGLGSGILGILLTLILILPLNLILQSLTGISYLKATLPFVASLILIAISVLLTVLAGLIPAKVASKKDPVLALRSE